MQVSSDEGGKVQRRRQEKIFGIKFILLNVHNLWVFTNLINLGKIFSLQERFSETSLITYFCFYLIFAIKYYFYCIISCHLVCICYGYGLFVIKAYR